VSDFYGAISFTPTNKQVKDRERKLKEAIEYLGDRYRLAKPVEKLDGGVACK